MLVIPTRCILAHGCTLDMRDPSEPVMNVEIFHHVAELEVGLLCIVVNLHGIEMGTRPAWQSIIPVYRCIVTRQLPQGHVNQR